MIDWSFLYLASEWAIRLVMLLYVPQRRSTAASRTWLLFIFLLPWPGLALYALVGRIRLPELRRKLQAQASLQIEKAQAQIGKRITLEPDLPAQLRIIPQQARKLGAFETFAGNALEFLRDYEGSVGYIGSQNVADPVFVKNYPNEELVARVTGPIVSQLQAVFLADHYLETEEALDREELFPELDPTGNSIAQLVPSGPGYGQEN